MSFNHEVYPNFSLQCSKIILICILNIVEIQILRVNFFKFNNDNLNMKISIRILLSAMCLIVLFGCGREKYTAEQVACYYKKCCEFMEKYNSAEDLQKAGEVIARTCGFGEEMDVQPALAEHIENPEVKKWYEKFNLLITNTVEEEPEVDLEQQLLDAFPDAEKTE